MVRLSGAEIKDWRGLVLLGGWAALAGVGLIAVQVVVYLLWPPPRTADEAFALMLEHPLQGFLGLDLLYVVSNLLAYLLYLALAVVLWRVSRSAVVVALALGTLGMAAYLSSLRFVEMLTLARSYAGADPAGQVALLATGEGMLATWTGSAFDAYYLLNLVALLVLAVLMLRSSVLSRATAVWGLVAALLMAVPSNLGTLGMVFALASLLPWSVFAVLVGVRLLRLARESGEEPRSETPGHRSAPTRPSHAASATSSPASPTNPT